MICANRKAGYLTAEEALDRGLDVAAVVDEAVGGEGLQERIPVVSR